MRAWIALTTAFIVPFGLLLAAPPPKQAPATDPRLEELLRGWEATSLKIKDLYCEFQKTTKDAVFPDTSVQNGKAWLMRPYFGRLDLTDDKGNPTSTFISTGKAIHQYEAKSKQEVVHILPDPKGADQTMPGPLSFVFGMTAKEAKRRFQFTLAREFAKNGVEYAELQVLPLTPDDQQEFKRARLVINKKTYLPKDMLIIEPNDTQQLWNITRIVPNPNPPIAADTFVPLKTPKDWKQQINRFDELEQPARPKAKADPSTSSRPSAARQQPKR
ncbi:MAG: outer-membrane lipoprotein carrier protein LolA [Planctomycetes bacterium]|nr:outer-membrane lipoprotein carrier protein LolA [Planctomycetota bacterium]